MAVKAGYLKGPARSFRSYAFYSLRDPRRILHPTVCCVPTEEQEGLLGIDLLGRE